MPVLAILVVDDQHFHRQEEKCSNYGQEGVNWILPEGGQGLWKQSFPWGAKCGIPFDPVTMGAAANHNMLAYFLADDGLPFIDGVWPLH